MKNLIFVLLVLAQAYTSIKLIESRHELRHKDALMTETVKQCGEAWLNTEVKR